MSSSLVDRYKSLVNELVTVERRQIVALTEITKETAASNPTLIPDLAQIVVNRALQVSADIKLPVLYLLDSITKNLGEPFTSCFAAHLPQIFDNAWTTGAPGLHRPLSRLAGTWNGIFPVHVMRAVDAIMNKTSVPLHTSMMSDGHKPMMKDPRLGTESQQAPVGDLLSMLASSGLAQVLSSVGTQSELGNKSLRSGEIAPAMELRSDTVKEKNPGAISRLLNATRHNQPIFLDSKFLKRKALDSNTRRSRMWYIDLETWFKGSIQVETDAKKPASAKRQLEQLSPRSFSVPVDESQTECAISGEKFERFWDETNQEWRYADTTRVEDPSLAQRLGIRPGSLVLASTVDVGATAGTMENTTLDARTVDQYTHVHNMKRPKLED